MPRVARQHGRVEIVNLQHVMPAPRAAIRKALRIVMREEIGREVDVSVALVDDRHIARLNERFLGHEGPTDVISFSLGEDAGVFGEIVISAERARDEARRRRLAPAGELLLYAVHGMLHLAGHDDATPAEARRMHRREAEILRRFGALRPSRGRRMSRKSRSAT